MDTQDQIQTEEASTSGMHSNRNRIVVVVATALVLFVLAAGVGWYWSHEQIDRNYQYTIPGVPTINMYDSRALNNGISLPFVGNLMSILQYWGVPVDFASRNLRTEMHSLVRDGYLHVEELELFLNERGLELDAVYANSFTDLAKYINPDNPVPLLYHQLFSTSDLNLGDYKLLIGLDLKNNEVVTNNFTRGHLYRVSVDMFDQLWDLHFNESSKRRYFVITPQDRQKIQERVEENKVANPYPPRTPVMDELEPIFVDFLSNTLSYAAYLQQGIALDEDWIRRLHSMIESPLFVKLHPEVQMSLYLGVAQYNIGHGRDLDVAYEYIEKGLELNENLDRPYPGWGETVHKKKSWPYFILTQYYVEKGELAKAKEIYEGPYATLHRETFGYEPNPYPF